MELFAAVKFKDFIRHYRKLGDAEIVADVQRSMDDLEVLNANGSSFGAEMVATMTARVNANREKNRANGRKGGRPRKQKEQEFLVNRRTSLPGTSSGNGEALNDEGATAPAGKHFEEARTPSAATTPVPASAYAVPEQGALLPEASTGRGGQISTTPVPASAHGNAAVGGLLTPWIGPGTGESFDQGPDNGHRLPATTRADAHAREDWDASTTVRAQDFDGDAATREGAEAAASGFATSPSDIQRRPGKSATTSYERPIRNGGSERGAGGTAIDAVRRSPGAGKRPEPPTIEELYAFASDACLHEMLCREWWEMTYGDRAGLDRDGRPIRNWKAACRAYVKKRISNMENEK